MALEEDILRRLERLERAVFDDDGTSILSRLARVETKTDMIMKVLWFVLTTTLGTFLTIIIAFIMHH